MSMFPGVFFLNIFFILKTTNNQATPLLSKNKYRLRAEEMALSVSCLQNEHEDLSLDPNIHGKVKACLSLALERPRQAKANLV